MNTALQWSELLLKIELGWRRQCFLGVCLMEWLDYKESAIEVQQPLSFCPPVYQEQIQTSKLHKMSENFAYLQSKSNLNTIERWLDDNKVISSEVQKTFSILPIMVITKRVNRCHDNTIIDIWNLSTYQSQTRGKPTHKERKQKKEPCSESCSTEWKHNIELHRMTASMYITWTSMSFNSIQWKGDPLLSSSRQFPQLKTL